MRKQALNLVIQTSAEGTAKTAGEIQRIRQALREAGQATQSLSQALGVAVDEAEQLSPEGVNRFANALKQAGGAAQQMGTQVGKSGEQAGFSVAELAAKYYLVIQAIQSLVSIAKPAYDVLVGQNERLQQQLLATQATLAATNQVFKDGVQITDPTQAIQALEGPVNAAIDKIRQGSLELVGVTSDQLIGVFQIVAGQAGQVGINLDQAAVLTLNLAAAMGTLGVPLDQARQEIQSILQGTIDQNSVVAKSLGITNEQVRGLKEQGRLYDFLNEKLVSFRAGNALAAQTIQGVSSNIQELINEITRVAGEGLIEPIVEELNGVFEFLRQNKDSLTEFLTNVVDGFLNFFEVIKATGEEVGKNLAPLMQQLSRIFDADLAKAVDVVITGVSKLVALGAEMLANNKMVQGLLEITDGIIGAVAALQSLTPGL